MERPFLRPTGASRDAFGGLRATAFIDEWLILSLPEARLEDPGVVRSVSYLVSNLNAESAQWGRYPMSTRELDGWMHALHALTLYDCALFPPPRPGQARCGKEAGEEGGGEEGGGKDHASPLSLRERGRG